MPSVDIYVTYTCNLRCAHCFVGENLETHKSFDYESLTSLFRASTQWGSEEITFLGGEPTLYPHILDAVKSAQSAGARVRIVTNGLHGFRKFMDNFDGDQLPQIGFSIDGSKPSTHNSIRGPRAFERLIPNIERAIATGYEAFGIVSVSRTNAADILDILDMCNDFGFSHVNVHYVTNRGFATEDMVVPVPQWQSMCRDIQRHSTRLSVDVRLERTFVAPGTHGLVCAVRDKSNLMFLPDGRVFMCPLFIDVPNAHSFTWSSAGLMTRSGKGTESALSEPVVTTHCPAMRYVNQGLNQTAEELGLQIPCVLEKTRLRSGDVINDAPVLS